MCSGCIEKYFAKTSTKKTHQAAPLLTTLIKLKAQVLIENRVQGKDAVRRICGRSLGGFKIPHPFILDKVVSFLPGSDV